MIDYTTDVGQVRLMIGDVDETASILGDNHITGYLALASGNVKLAAAKALDAIASSESLLSKKINSKDVATDGPAVAADLRKHAVALRAEVASEAEAEGGFFDIIPFAVSSKAEGEEARL